MSKKYRQIEGFASKVATIFLHIFGFIHETSLGYIAIEVVLNKYVVGKNILETTALEKIHDIIARVRNNLISTLINPTSTLLQCHLPLLARRFRMCQMLELMKKRKGQEISKAIFLETTLLEKLPKLFEGFLP